MSKITALCALHTHSLSLSFLHMREKLRGKVVEQTKDFLAVRKSHFSEIPIHFDGEKFALGERKWTRWAFHFSSDCSSISLNIPKRQRESDAKWRGKGIKSWKNISFLFLQSALFFFIFLAHKLPTPLDEPPQPSRLFSSLFIIIIIPAAIARHTINTAKEEKSGEKRSFSSHKIVIFHPSLLLTQVFTSSRHSTHRNVNSA